MEVILAKPKIKYYYSINGDEGGGIVVGNQEKIRLTAYSTKAG